MSQVAVVTPALELVGLTKYFGDVLANSGIDLTVEAGTIHGVIGENGAGKSTAMKMLYGMFTPDLGEIRIHGRKVHFRSPMDAIHSGIGMVHQHFMLAGPHTALDNILLGTESGAPSWLPKSLRLIDRRQARQKLLDLSKQYGLVVDFDQLVERLPVGIQQRIEILKLLYRDAHILILDEPTAVLTPQETTELFANLRKLKAEGKTILIITHKLKEVMSITDRVTVFRRGKVTGEVRTADTSSQGLADLMVGRKVMLSVEVPPLPVLGNRVCEAHALGLTGKLQGLSFTVNEGEIVGVAGVEGNGQSELVQALLHPGDPTCRSEGELSILGRDASEWSASQVKQSGVGVIPEDRHREGLLLDSSLEENFLLGLQSTSQFSRYGWIDKKSLRESATRAVATYDVRPPELNHTSGMLSGGNQQKLIIAREFERKPRFLIAAQPTRGVDVGAIEFIHKRILQARAEGAGVLLVSSELDEILALSDRILVMYEGRIAAEFKRGECSEQELGLRMGGAGVHAQ